MVFLLKALFDFEKNEFESAFVLDDPVIFTGYINTKLDRRESIPMVKILCYVAQVIRNY